MMQRNTGLHLKKQDLYNNKELPKKNKIKQQQYG